MSVSSEQHGGGWGGGYGRGLSWEAFDAMPWALRRLYCFAAYNYTPARAFDMWVDGQDVDRIVWFVRRAMRRAVARETRRLYGPDHPQAQA